MLQSGCKRQQVAIEIFVDVLPEKTQKWIGYLIDAIVLVNPVY